MKRSPAFFSQSCPAAAICLLVLVTTLLAAGCINGILNGSGVVSPHIVPVDGAPAPARPQYTFPFQKTTITVTLPVNGSVYAGAKAAEKEVTIYGNVSEQDWMAQSYQSMIGDPAQEEFYRDLIGQLRSVRSGSSLNDDEYLELVAVFVQSIPYETVGESPPKFPIETFADKSGDCDDKSLLLAALLSREDYRVALLSFRPESHMAVGIVCPGTDYRNSGYAYLETTNVTYAGVPPDGLSSGVVIASDPLVIPVGSGIRTYGACNQTQYLHEMYTATEKQFSDLSREAGTTKAELQAPAAAKNINAYNQRVAYYNSLVNRLKQNAAVHNYILNHQYDRKGTYEWVKTHLSGL